nr:error-prone DNA polymerase [Deltaproteobacteria bacterium]
MGYAELVARTGYSLLEGASLPHEMVESALAAGISHLGIVDRDCVYGAVQAYKAAKGTGLHLVVGAAVTVADHPAVVLLAQDLRGWSRLCHLLTRAREADSDRAPAARRGVVKGRGCLELAEIAERTEGLACVLRFGWEEPGARVLREAFGDRLRIGWSRTLAPSDRARLAWASGLSDAVDARVIATNDVLLHTPERQPLADVLTCIRRKTTLHAAGKALLANGERHVLTEAEFRSRYAEIPDAADEAVRLAESCSFSLADLRYGYPREVVPEGFTPMGWLERLIREGLAERYPQGVPASVEAQVAHELAVIEDLDFPSYFLTVHDVVAFARSKRILCQGRGSAANSAVCYALGITAVDPARSTLLFERFISRERGEPPDIDVDFEHERREEVIQYIYARYGRHRAGMVNEFICYRGRSAIRDVGKVFGLSLDQVDRLAKAMDRWSAGPLAAADDLVREAGLDPDAPEVQATLRASEGIRDFPRHVSIHVGGFVIAAGDLRDLVPVEPATMVDRTVIAWDKYDIDVLQFVKVDVLALGILTAIRKAFRAIEGFSGVSWELATIPAEDPAVYDMFCEADTVGVFQIESRAQMSMLPRLKPRCFYDLVIEVSIVRPGPIQGGMVHPYLRRRNGDEPITYAHPALEPILERTLGVPLFQEQVMAMASAVGGFTPGEADELRRAMGAWRKRGNLMELGARLVRGMVERGIAPDYADAVLNQILGFGEYGFPESHAASFALLIYVSGWLKCHHPAAFTAALLNSQPMGFYSPHTLLADAQRHGVTVFPVSAERSEWECTLTPDVAGKPAIRLGLRMVRGLGEEDGHRLLAARAERPFRDLVDVALRAGLDRGLLQTMAEAGAFACWEPDRRQAAWKLHGLWSDLPLFAGVARKEPVAPLPVADAVER